MASLQPIRPRNLAIHASKLANHHARQGRPLPTWLRRSTSASYYAVFHAVGLAVARHLAPHSAAQDQMRLVRSLDHAKVAEVCAWVRGRGDEGREHVRPIVKRLRLNPDVAELAGIFGRLQQARHAADYDHLAEIRKAPTLAHYREALRALDIIETLPGTIDGEEFLALVALHTSLR